MTNSKQIIGSAPSPFEKKRERTIIKASIGIVKSAILCGLFGYAIFFLPLVLYLVFSEQTISGIYLAHPVGTVLYSVAILILMIFSISLILTFSLFKSWKGHDYDMEWLRTFHKNHAWAKIAVNLKSWEKLIAECKNY